MNVTCPSLKALEGPRLEHIQLLAFASNASSLPQQILGDRQSRRGNIMRLQTVMVRVRCPFLPTPTSRHRPSFMFLAIIPAPERSLARHMSSTCFAPLMACLSPV